MDRTIRVFISSTFRDMQAERDYLVKFTFPQLRKLCESRGVTWGEVDLRWGITDEEKAEGKVLPLCLEEIHRCRPYFIGLLGERYGWIPDAIPPEILEREGWLREHVNERKSVTELEVLHGVLNNPEMANHAFFYFRDPKYIEQVSPEDRNNFIPEDAQSTEKLKDLKERIRHNHFPVRESYADPKALGELVLKDFTELIERLYPAGEEPDPLDREAADHEAFAQSRARVYIGRQEYFDRLDEQIAGDGPPLVVLGESGAGKSALLANWLLSYRKQHPGEFAFIHFIGATPNSADWSSMLRRIMLELQRLFPDDLSFHIPIEREEIRSEFPRWLAEVAASGRLVLILDGLNQLEDREGAPDLMWLPIVFPPNCRVILSTLPGRCLDVIRHRQWREMTVERLTVQERNELLEKFLGQFSKKLTPSQTGRILSAEQTANPLYLSTLLDELRQFGSHELLEQRLSWYLESADIPKLFESVLRRWEEDFGETLVRRTFSSIWASRFGLSEAELLDLLGGGEKPLPRAQWTPVLLASGWNLVTRRGLLNFGHAYLRAGVESAYVSTEREKRDARRRLAIYFDRDAFPTNRKLDEEPWLFQRAEAWEQLKDIVTTIPIFIKLRSTERWRWELLGYWVSLASHYLAGASYTRALAEWEAADLIDDQLLPAINQLAAFHYERAEYSTAEPLMRRSIALMEKTYGENHYATGRAVGCLAQLLQSTNRLSEAEPLMRRVLAIDEQTFGPMHHDIATDLNNLGQLLRVRNRLAEAEPMLRRSLDIDVHNFGPEHPDVALRLNNLASLFKETNRFAEAESLMRRALAINEQNYGLDHPHVAIYLHNLSDMLVAMNQTDEAEPLGRRALAIFETSLGKDHPNVAVALINLARLLQNTNRVKDSEPLMRRALAIFELSLGKDHPMVARALSNLAGLLHETSRLKEAELVSRRALEIDEVSFGPDHPNVATDLNNIAQLLRDANRFEDAESLLRRALLIDEASFGPDHPDVAIRLNNLAKLLQRTNRLSEAEPLMRRALTIDENSYGPEHPTVAGSLTNLAGLLKATNRLPEAEALMVRALAVFEKGMGGNHPDVATALSSLALLYVTTNRDKEAEPLMRRALAIDEESLGTDHPKVASDLSNLGKLLLESDRLEEAEPLLRQSSRINEKSFGPDDPQVAISLSLIANLLQVTDRLDEAEPLWQRALAIDERIYGLDHPEVACDLSNLASLLLATNRPIEAEPLMRRALAIDEKSLGLDHPNVAVRLNNLARLLQDIHQHGAAEPLMRRSVEILIRFTMGTGHQHPNFEPVLSNYTSLLAEMGLNEAQIIAKVGELSV